MDATVKTSFSVKKPLWTRLSKASNRSAVVNAALEMYFDRKEFLDNAEETYWNKIESSLANGDGEYISLNPKGKKLTKEDINKKLWN